MNIESSKKRPISKLASKLYTPEKIAEKARTGYHGNETMMQVFQNIIHDPHIIIAEPDKKGNSDILYDGKNIGWINIERGMGWIDDKAYDKLQKYVAPEPTLDSLYEDIDDEDEDNYDEYEDEEDELSEDDINASEKIIAANEEDNIVGLESALRSELNDSRLMADTVNSIYSNTGDFDGDVFTNADEFLETVDLKNVEKIKDLLTDFYNGEDLDSNSDTAIPTRDYFRRDGYGHVESTNDPGQVYIDEILDNVVDYIMDHSDDTFYPDDIIDIIEQYSEDIEEE